MNFLLQIPKRSNNAQSAFLTAALRMAEDHKKEMDEKRAAFVKEVLTHVAELRQTVASQDLDSLISVEIRNAVEAMKRWMEHKSKLMDEKLKGIRKDMEMKERGLENSEIFIHLEREIKWYQEKVAELTTRTEALQGEITKLGIRKGESQEKLNRCKKVMREIGLSNVRLYAAIQAKSIQNDPPEPTLTQTSITPEPICNLTQMVSIREADKLTKLQISASRLKRSVSAMKAKARATRNAVITPFLPSRDYQKMFTECLKSAISGDSTLRKSSEASKSSPVKVRLKERSLWSVLRFPSAKSASIRYPAGRSKPYMSLLVFKSIPKRDVLTLLAADPMTLAHLSHRTFPRCLPPL